MKIIGKSINGLIISRITSKTSELDKIKKNEGAIVNYKGICYDCREIKKSQSWANP